MAGFQANSGAFGLQADYFGYSNYNETQIGLGYARSLGKKIDVGENSIIIMHFQFDKPLQKMINPITILLSVARNSPT